MRRVKKNWGAGSLSILPLCATKVNTYFIKTKPVNYTTVLSLAICLLKYRYPLDITIEYYISCICQTNLAFKKNKMT